MATAFGVYDATESPVRIACVLPDSDNYWSISLYAWNSDNFYVVNDRTAPAKEFNLIIVSSRCQYGGSQDVASQHEAVVLSPSKKGVVMVRMVVRDRDNARELEQVEEVIKKTVIISGPARPLPFLRAASGSARV